MVIDVNFIRYFNNNKFCNLLGGIEMFTDCSLNILISFSPFHKSLLSHHFPNFRMVCVHLAREKEYIVEVTEPKQQDSVYCQWWLIWWLKESTYSLSLTQSLIWAYYCGSGIVQPVRFYLLLVAMNMMAERGYLQLMFDPKH